MAKPRASGWDDLSVELEDIILGHVSRDLVTMASLTNVSPRLRELAMPRLAAATAAQIDFLDIVRCIEHGCCAALGVFLEKLGNRTRENLIRPMWSELLNAATTSGSLACLQTVFNLRNDPLSGPLYLMSCLHNISTIAASRNKPLLLWSIKQYAAKQGHLGDLYLSLYDGCQLDDVLFALAGLSECKELLIESKHAEGVKYLSSRRLIVLQTVKQQRLDRLELLLKNGAVTKAARKDGWTALHEAVQKQHREAMDMLLSYGANPNIELPHSGVTPLYIAIKAVDFPAIDALLAAGADVYHAINEHGNMIAGPGARAFELAVSLNNLPMMKRFSRAMKESGRGYGAPKRWDTIKHCITTGNVEFLKAVLDAGANVNVMDDGGYQPIHWAVKSGNAQIVKCLIAAGAMLNARTYHNQYPEDFLDDLDEISADEVKKALSSSGQKIGQRPLNMPYNNMPYNNMPLKAVQRPQNMNNIARKKSVPMIMRGGSSVRTGTGKKAGAAMVEFANLARQGRAAGRR